MKLSMACVRLSSKFLNPGSFGIKGCRLSVPFSAIGGSGRIVSRCSASGQSESIAPGQRIAVEDNPFVKPLSNVYFVVPCRLCQGM